MCRMVTGVGLSVVFLSVTARTALVLTSTTKSNEISMKLTRFLICDFAKSRLRSVQNLCRHLSLHLKLKCRTLSLATTAVLLREN